MKIKINILKQIFFLFVLLSLLVLPYFVFAQDTSEETNTNSNSAINRLETVGTGDGAYAVATETTFSSIIGQAVNILLSFLGIIFIVLIIIAGFQWMTASGNEEQIANAKKNISNATIGLIIVVSAYAVWAFISSQLL
jgi:amino acid transporter